MSKKSSHPPLSSFLPPVKPLTGKETDLQLLVRTQRALIIEPAIQKAEEFLASFPPDSDCERESKKENSRRRRTGLGLIRPRGPSGVFVRKDTEDSADIEVIDGHQNHQVTGSNGTTANNNAKRRRSSAASTIHDTDIPCLAQNKPKRTRRPSTRLLSVFDNSATSHNASQDDEASSNHDTRRSASIASLPPPAPTTLPRLTIRIPARPYKPPTTVSASQPSSSRVQLTPTTPSTNANGVDDDDDDDMQSVRSKSESPSTPYDEDDSVSNRTPTHTHTHTQHRHHHHREDEDEGESEVDHDYTPQRRSASTTKLTREERKKGGTVGNGGTGVTGGKPKTATFNMPWSMSEQHLLEKLLEEIPQGEANRWVKISAAMQGRRTARQVASRVQKYFEKLKKFGAE